MLRLGAGNRIQNVRDRIRHVPQQILENRCKIANGSRPLNRQAAPSGLKTTAHDEARKNSFALI